MKHILTILFLIISFTSFAQTIKVKGDGSIFDSTQINSKLAGKLNISDTAAMLAPYANYGLSIHIVKQIYTGSSSVTATDSTTWLIINPSSLVAALTITMATSPVDGQDLIISFGGTITSGTVVTSLTISPNTGQSILQSSTPSTIGAGEAIKYRYEGVSQIWYRL